MIKKINPENGAGGFQLIGDANVALRWFESAAGMVMSDNHGGSPIGNRVCINFSWMNRCPVDQTDRDDTNIENFIGTVNRGTQKMFLFTIGKMADMWQQIGRGLNPRSLRFNSSSSKFDGSQN